ncbi:hypothetical protein [Dorea sp. D27]|uniref:hypothetical protein n=1 Tax=Dorea sp. D27 TaxID=658665 RepID=UPI0006A201C7|nr:hypothetical protein [Dorea sp. D27]KMZ55345.1 hypothetical protein HMPREF0980_00693 [Dorea sp. D27]
MKKYLSRITSSLMIALILSILMFSTIAKANEEFKLYPETQAAIEDASQRNLVDKAFINNVIDLFNKEIHTNSEELNEFVNEALIQSIEMNKKTNEELKMAQENANALVESQENKAAITRVNPIDAARTAYYAGILMVESKGCTQTAKYMRHADQNNPPTYYNRNDDWASKCAFVQELFDKIELQFNIEIAQTGKLQGSVYGTFAYTIANSSLDQYTALHNVNYQVAFKKQSNGYAATYYITDVYDFAWGKYDSLAVGFGNNYCYAMQTLGLIHPFKISIVYAL